MSSMLHCLFWVHASWEIYNPRSRWLWCIFPFVPLRHLSWQPDKSPFLKVILKQSKTEPFCRGVNIYLGATDRPICPILGILLYLAARGNRAGPLFVTEDSKGLTCQIFSALLNSLLSKLHLDTKSFNTHSFWIGAATSAALAHIPDSYIKMMGHWQSDAYRLYIKTPPKELAKLSGQLVTPARQKHWTVLIHSLYFLSFVCLIFFGHWHGVSCVHMYIKFSTEIM